MLMLWITQNPKIKSDTSLIDISADLGSEGTVNV
jgi:hypothetical protein